MGCGGGGGKKSDSQLEAEGCARNVFGGDGWRGGGLRTAGGCGEEYDAVGDVAGSDDDELNEKAGCCGGGGVGDEMWALFSCCVMALHDQPVTA